MENKPTADQYLEIDADQYHQLQQKPTTLTIDVREDFERPILEGSSVIKIPMSALPNFLNNEITATAVIFVCQHGIRSAAAAEMLVEKYGDKKKAYSLKGGISKWHKQLIK